MRIHFYKLHLGGNSFILIDTESEKDLKLSEYPEISKSICNRRYGVGASGCIFLDEKNNIFVNSYAYEDLARSKGLLK